MRFSPFIFIALLSSGCLLQGSSLITTDKKEYMRNEPIHVTIENRRENAIYFGGCNDFIVEKKIGEEWKVAIQKLCIWEGIPTRLSPGEKKTYEMRLEEEGTYRIRFEYGLNCSEGTPLSRANCTEFKTIYVEYRVG